MNKTSTSAPAHLLGPWDYFPPIASGSEGIAFVIYPANTSEPLAEVLARDGDEDIARLMAAAPLLLDELQKAHKVIENAKAVMTSEQYGKWSRANYETRCTGEGTTRAIERRSVIARATAVRAAAQIGASHGHATRSTP